VALTSDSFALRHQPKLQDPEMAQVPSVQVQVRVQVQVLRLQVQVQVHRPTISDANEIKQDS